jgi:hypothetical protein
MLALMAMLGSVGVAAASKDVRCNTTARATTSTDAAALPPAAAFRPLASSLFFSAKKSSPLFIKAADFADSFGRQHAVLDAGWLADVGAEAVLSELSGSLSRAAPAVVDYYNQHGEEVELQEEEERSSVATLNAVRAALDSSPPSSNASSTSDQDQLGVPRSAVLRFGASGGGGNGGTDSEATPLASLLRDLSDSVQKTVTANAYFSLRHASALAPHTDMYDVVVIQVEGSKTWSLCTPPHKDTGNVGEESSTEADAAMLFELQAKNPLGCTVHEAPAADDSGLVCTNFTLIPGQILYLPKGVIHSAVAGHEGSTHVTVSETFYPAFIYPCADHVCCPVALSISSCALSCALFFALVFCGKSTLPPLHLPPVYLH